MQQLQIQIGMCQPSKSDTQLDHFEAESCQARRGDIRYPFPRQQMSPAHTLATTITRDHEYARESKWTEFKLETGRCLRYLYKRALTEHLDCIYEDQDRCK